MKTAIKSNFEAVEVARDYAASNNVNEARAEAFAEAWFDAGKDDDKSAACDLCAYLDKKFETGNEDDSLDVPNANARTSAFGPKFPLRIEHHPRDVTHCPWHLVDASGGCLQVFPTEQAAVVELHLLSERLSAQLSLSDVLRLDLRNANMTCKELVEKINSDGERSLTLQAVSNWKSDGYIPPARIDSVLKALGKNSQLEKSITQGRFLSARSARAEVLARNKTRFESGFQSPENVIQRNNGAGDEIEQEINVIATLMRSIPKEKRGVIFTSIVGQLLPLALAKTQPIGPQNENT